MPYLVTISITNSPARLEADLDDERHERREGDHLQARPDQSGNLRPVAVLLQALTEEPGSCMIQKISYKQTSTVHRVL